MTIKFMLTSLVYFMLLSVPQSVFALGEWFQWDTVPATPDDQIPVSGPDLTYSHCGSSERSCYTQPDGSVVVKLDNPSLRFFGFFQIDDERAVKGHSLELVTTGGGPVSSPNGSHIQNKQEYLDELALGIDPTSKSGAEGRTSIIFDAGAVGRAFPEANGANRLSFYVYMDTEQMAFRDEGTRRALGQVELFMYSAISFEDMFPNWVADGGAPGAVDTAHLYQGVPAGGGGWTHISVDSKYYRSAYNSNGGPFPYPSKSYRQSPPEQYFNNARRLAIIIEPQQGYATPKPIVGHSTWFDEFEWRHDPEPQNHETIGPVSLLYVAKQKRWEVGFISKYASNKDNGTYEARYSFAPITNANWSLAKPVTIQHGHQIPAKDPLAVDAAITDPTATPGRFRAVPNNVDGSVWAPFRIDQEDWDQLTIGTMVYFAIKDVSQINGDGLAPINGDSNAGRDYAGSSGYFDYEGDQPALNLIRRIDYYIAEESDNTDFTAPDAVTNLQFVP